MAGLPIPPIIGLPGAVAKNAPKAAAKTVALSALIHDYWPPGETTKEGDAADKVAQGLVWAESSADPNAKNDQPCSNQGDHAVGLLQICTPMHMTEAAARNPRKNLAK